MEAEPLYREALEAHRTALGPKHPNTLAALSGLANLLRQQVRRPVLSGPATARHLRDDGKHPMLPAGSRLRKRKARCGYRKCSDGVMGIRIQIFPSRGGLPRA